MVYKALAGAMQGLDVLLLYRLLGHKLHMWLSPRNADRLGIVAVILLALPCKWLDKLWPDNANGMSCSFKPARPVERTGAGFDDYRAR